MKYVIIRDQARGNDTVGEAWQETAIFEGSATLDEVMRWAMTPSRFDSGAPSQLCVTITRPEVFDGSKPCYA